MRLFIAIIPPPRLIKSWLDFSTTVNLPGRPVKPEQIHLTVNFLGEIKADLLPAVAKAIDKTVKLIPQFSLTVGQFGWLPVNQPRLGIINIKDSAAFSNLQYKLKLALLNLKINTSANQPHLTVIRLSSKSTKSNPFNFQFTDSFLVTNVELINSALAASGPTYETLKNFKLAPNPVKFRANVVICLVNHNSQVLLVKHPLSKSNLWQLPQGGIEPAETTAQAVSRELKEELDLNNFQILSIKDRIHRYRWPAQLRREGTDKSKSAFIGQEQSLAVVMIANNYSALKPDAREIMALKWVKHSDMLKLLTPVRREVGKIALAEIKRLGLAS
ncbi:MAG: RNA 2',3'-cyclic phosphodiesterase [Patescibacteria group bacterium]